MYLIQENGLTNDYINNQVFPENVRMICGLAFVPLHDIERSFEALSQNCIGLNLIEPILDYFETNYVGEMRRGVRRPPTFDHSMWSVYERVINRIPRTTNALEGWHNAFAQSVGQSHATLWKFINTLKNEHVHVHLAIAHHDNYVPVPPSRLKYSNVNHRISNIVADYGNRNIIDYLRTISFNIF